MYWTLRAGALSYLPGFHSCPVWLKLLHFQIDVEENAAFALWDRIAYLSTSECNLITFLWPIFEHCVCVCVCVCVCACTRVRARAQGPCLKYLVIRMSGGGGELAAF